MSKNWPLHCFFYRGGDQNVRSRKILVTAVVWFAISVLGAFQSSLNRYLRKQMPTIFDFVIQSRRSFWHLRGWTTTLSFIKISQRRHTVVLRLKSRRIFHLVWLNLRMIDRIPNCIPLVKRVLIKIRQNVKNTFWKIRMLWSPSVR